MKKCQGITLIEWIVVVAVVGILAATVLPKFMDLGPDARVAAMQATEGAMRSANTALYTRAAAVRQQDVAVTTLPLPDGKAVGLRFGYAADAGELSKAMRLDASRVELAGKNELIYRGKPACRISYTAPTAAGVPPAYNAAAVRAENC
ncbi:MAG: hypothetical protein RIR00_461 [Pseudomonadota bacterium]|jgi:MSHA pilin protein MshA